MANGGDSAAKELQRADRRGRGVPAERYGDWVSGVRRVTATGSQVASIPLHVHGNENDRASIHSNASRRSQASVRVSTANVNRRKLEAELKAAKELEELRTSTIQKQLALDRARIEEEEAEKEFQDE